MYCAFIPELYENSEGMIPLERTVGWLNRCSGLEANIASRHAGELTMPA